MTEVAITGPSHSSKAGAAKPMVLPDPVSSWGYILDNQRITSQQTAGEVAAVQLRAAVALLPKGLRPLLTADR